MRVLIVGAGPTGLTAGTELARLGAEVTVIDKRQSASGLSRAVGILPKSLELLEASGVTTELLEHGIPLHDARIYLEQRLACTLPLTGPRPHSFLLAMAQDETEGILRSALQRHGGTLRYATEFRSLHQDDAGVTVEVNRDEERFDILIGADGIRSRVRECLGIPFHGHDLPESWSIADVDADDWRHPESFTAFVMPAAREVVVAPIGPHRYRLVSNTDDALALLPLPLQVRKIRRQGQFKIAIRQVPRYRDGRVYLAGDSAHCHSPVGGRGMNLGIADAAELARRLVDGTAHRYSASRHREGKATIAASELARKFLMATWPGSNAARGLFFRTVDTLPPLQRGLARRILFP